MGSVWRGRSPFLVVVFGGWVGLVGLGVFGCVVFKIESRDFFVDCCEVVGFC